MNPQQNNAPQSVAPQPTAPQAPFAQAQFAQQAPVSNIPASWPGAFGIFNNSKASVLVNIWPLIILYLASATASYVLSLVLKVPGQIVGNILSIYFSIATYFVMLAGIRGIKMPVGDALKKALDIKLFLKMFVLMLVLAIALGFSALLLLIPFIILMPRLIFAPYFLIDKNMGISDALNASWEQSKGHSGKVWGIIGASIVMILPMLTIIGIPVAFYLIIMYSAATFVLYGFIISNHGTPVAGPVGPMPAGPQPLQAAVPQAAPLQAPEVQPPAPQPPTPSA